MLLCYHTTVAQYSAVQYGTVVQYSTVLTVPVHVIWIKISATKEQSMNVNCFHNTNTTAVAFGAHVGMADI